MSDPIGKLHKYPALVVRKAEHLAYENTLPKHTEFLVSSSALVGIEIEVENMPNYVDTTYYWRNKSDGSLRNNGVEFTSIPLRCSQVPYALQYLNSKITENNTPDFSPRTSCHVHLNARDMSWEQLKVFVLLYAIFERHFFHIAGTKREQSIFCVPLYLTQELRYLLNLEHQVTNWHKYSAINLGTILGNADVPCYGTIEFRHLYGTSDPGIILDWINNICCLREYSRKVSLNDLLQRIKVMNTTSEYIALYQEVFDSYADIEKMSKYDFEYCISQTKIALWGKEGFAKFPSTEKSSYLKKITDPVKEEDMIVKTPYGNIKAKKHVWTINPPAGWMNVDVDQFLTGAA